MSNVLNSNNNGKNFLLSLETRGIKLGLKRTVELFNICNHPEDNLKSIQVIGTNGKGSTAATLSSILIASGLKVGLYTSPHLVDLSERIQINNQVIDNQFIDNFIDSYRHNIEKLESTFFEVLTVMAACYFNEKDVDIAIFETGLGGRYDSVTACKANIQLFTKISIDHAHILGNTIEEIALDKSCAIHKNSNCFSVRQTNNVKNILTQKAMDMSASLTFTKPQDNKVYKSNLLGSHQIENTQLAITAAKHIIDIKEDEMQHGLNNVQWRGRMELLYSEPKVYFDVAHNDDSIIAFCDTIDSLNHNGDKTLIISVQESKLIEKSIKQLEQRFSNIIITQLNNRMYKSIDLASMFLSQSKIEIIDDPNLAIKAGFKNSKKSDLLAIIGSHYWGDIVYKNF